ncbi:hypothetical protein [Priestia megaterium]|uniref:hypothetical protein n=1 Tax=Priestia megaterium TaxID=1404 RepID=UPI000BF4B276|nr:hypothetical protein [Priestia megaterium]PFW43762.1 hypothetical protein COL17_26505 [Priestia megaterium]
MGAASIDLNAKERTLEVLFPLDSESGVSKLLYNLAHVEEMRYYAGDYGACDLLLDLYVALKNIKLSKTQKRIIKYHYILDLTQTETAKKLLENDGIDITQQAISENLKTINRRISKYYEKGLVVE